MNTLKNAVVIFGLACTTALVGGAGPAAADPKEAGIWYDDTGKGAVKIEICTPTTLCGKIYWLKEPLNAKGEPKTDKYNPEPTMRTRPICGLPILGELEQMSEGGFDNGWVYDPKEGKSYSVALDLVDQNTLKVTGYKGMRFLGKSFIWTRAPADLPNCATDAATAAPEKSGDATATDAAPKKTKTKAEKSKGDKAKTASKSAATSAAKLGAADVSTDHKVKKKKAEKAERSVTPPPPVASN